MANNEVNIKTYDPEKWSLMFYGIIDERFAVETDIFNLHIHRKNGIKKLQVERSEGMLDIYLPHEWDMEQYCNQEKLRKLMTAEIKSQALNIYQKKTYQIAKRIGLLDTKVSVGNVGNNTGVCYYWDNRVYFNMWTICSFQSQHIDALISHELAHFSVHGHSKRFWDEANRIFMVADIDNKGVGDTIQVVYGNRDPYHIYYLLKYWTRPSYLKDIFDRGLVLNKEPLKKPIYEDTGYGKKEIGFLTAFKIRI